MKKKHPKANLENYSKLFAQLGLVLSLFVVYLLIQNKTFENEIVGLSDSGQKILDDDPNQVVYNIVKPVPKIPIPKADITKIIKKDDDAVFEEPYINPIDPDTSIDLTTFVDVKPDEDIDSKDDIFDIMFLEEAPLFPGCKGTNDERKACFSKQINKYINRKFNAGLAEELGLSPGIQRIYTVFKIDKNGNIIDIEARAPHKRLKEEAIRVIKLLPKMEPGKQQGKPVKVRYSMPIVFKVE